MNPGSDPRPRRHPHVPRANSRPHGGLQLENIESQRLHVVVEKDWKGRPTAEETANRRREQNRASQVQ